MLSGVLTKLYTRKHLWRSAIFSEETASKIIITFFRVNPVLEIKTKLDEKLHWYFPRLSELNTEWETQSDQISNFSLKSCQQPIKELDMGEIEFLNQDNNQRP